MVMKLIPARYTRIVEVCMEREEWLWLMYEVSVTRSREGNGREKVV